MFGFGRNTADATIRFNADTKQAKTQMSSLMGTVKGLAAGFGSLLIVQKVSQFMNESVAAAQESEKANTMLTAALGRTSQGLTDYADAMMKKSIYDDEAIKQAMAQVGAFIKEEEQIKKLIPAIMDFAAAKQMDLVSAAELVTKSVAGNVNIFGRYGIQIKGAAGSTERAESAIRGITKAWGGWSEAITHTASGRMQQLKNEMGELQEKLGEHILPAQIAWNELMLQMATAIVPSVASHLDDLILTQKEAEEAANEGIARRLEDERMELETQIKMADILKRKKVILYESGERRVVDLGVARAELKMISEDLDKVSTKAGRVKDTVTGGGTKPPPVVDEEAAKKAAEERKKLTEQAEQAVAEAHKTVLQQTHEGRLKLIDEQESEVLQLLERAGVTRSEAYEEIQKSFGAQRMVEVQGEEETINEIVEKEGERQLKLFDERQQKKKEIADKAKDDQIKIAEEEAEGKEKLWSASFQSASIMSDAVFNFQVANLKRTAKSQEEYDKKMADLERQAANRQYALMLFEKGAALTKAGIALGTAVAKSAEHGASYGGVYGALAEAIIAGAELAFVVSEIAATNVEAPKFELGRIGGRSRRRGFDSFPAMLGAGETIIPATQSAMHSDELEAIRNNTANTAMAVRGIKGGAVVYNFYGVSTEQLLQAQVATKRTASSGRRL